MSMLNQSGEEQVECPLCMEALEVDDLNFFPCTCGYQICRFCWHRIRTDENGLCPACRKAYPENPADFKPLTQEEVAKLKAEKRHKDQQRKQKITENRKHLANVRVVQRNLVFVVGLPMRLADPEVLKKHEYFGKFGKIHKVVINQSTTYAGSQGPSASAYVTYHKADDALRAIQAVNNIVVDGRTIKTSLGTTKYCSHFMKNQTCPKPDCMYLHDLGDVEASFTKEEMQQGKHQEYERKLHELLLNNYNQGSKDSCSLSSSNQSYSKEAWPSLQPGAAPPRTKSGSSTSTSSNASNCSNISTNSSNSGCGNGNQNGCNANSACYSHHGSSRRECRQKSDQTSCNVSSKGSGPNHKKRHGLEDHKGKGKEKSYSVPQDDHSTKILHCKLSQSNSRANSKTVKEGSHGVHNVSTVSRCPHPTSDVDVVLEETHDGGLRADCDLRTTCESKVSGSDEDSESSSKGGSGGRTLPTTHRTAALFEPDNNSFFSTNSFTKVSASAAGSAGTDWPVNGLTLTHIPDVLPPVHSSEDWQAAFGFSNSAVSIPSNQSESSYPQGVIENPSLNSEYSGGKSGENCDTVSYDSQNGQAIPSQGFNCLSSSSSAENISLSGVPSSQEEYGLTEVGNLTEKLNELLLEGVNCPEVKEMATCPAGNCEMSAENVRLHITASCENVRVLPDGQNHIYHNIPSPASSDDPSIFMVNKPCPVQSSNHVIANGIQPLQAAKFLSEFHVKHNNVPNINKIPADMCVHPLMEGEAFSGHNGEGNASTVVVNANSLVSSGEGPNLLCLLKSGHTISGFSSSANGDTNDSAIVSAKCSNEKYSNSDIFKRQIGCESASEIIVYNREHEISVLENIAESSKENHRVPDDDLGFDPFHETQKALAEMMEKENMMLMLQGQHNDVRHPNSHISHLNQLHQQYQQMSHNNHHPAQFSQAAMFGANKVLPGYPAPMQPQILQNNHRLPANGGTISMCSKVDGITLGPSPGLASVPPRARLPPPGFTIAPNHMNAFGLGIPRAPSATGNKILPFMGLGNSSNSSNSGNSSPIPLNLNSMSNNISIPSALNVQQTLSNINPPPMLFPHSASQTNGVTQLNNSYNSRNGTVVHNSTVPKAALGRLNVKEWPDNLRPLLPIINSGSGVSHSPVPLAFSGSNNPTPPTPPPPPAPSHLVAASSSSPSSSSSSSSPSSSPSSSSPPPPAPSSSTSSSSPSPPPPSQPPSPPPPLTSSSCTPPPPSLAASPPPTAVPAAPPMPAEPPTTLHNSSCNGLAHGAQKSPAKPWSGAGPCSDWTVLDPAIMSSRPHNIFSSSSVGHQHPIIFCNTHSLLNQQSQNAQYLHLQNTTHWLRSFASDGCLLYGTNISDNVSNSDWTVLSHNSNSVASPPPGFSLRMTSPQTSIENKLAVAASQEITKIESELCSDYC